MTHTAVATVAAIELCGAIPVLVDIDPETFTLDPNHLDHTIKKLFNDKRSRISGRLKAIIPVHLYGHPADMENTLCIHQGNQTTCVTVPPADHVAIFLRDVFRATDTGAHEPLAQNILSDATTLHRLRQASAG